MSQPTSVYRRSVRTLRCILERSQHGQAIIWIAVMLPFFLSIIGLAIDGGVVFSARRELQNLADGAARAAVTEIDEPLYLSTATVALDPRAARRQAEEYLADYADRRGSPFRQLEATSIEVSTRAVAVEVRAQVPLAFLRIVGWQSVSVMARAPAVSRYGITEGR